MIPCSDPRMSPSPFLALGLAVPVYCVECETRPITDPKQILNEEIRRHALDGSKATVTRNFVAIEEGREVAFVSLDIFPPSQQPRVLYTLAVPALLREKGIGSRVLAEVERLAKKWGYSKVLLGPKSLDQRWSNERLREWYSRRATSPRTASAKMCG